MQLHQPWCFATWKSYIVASLTTDCVVVVVVVVVDVAVILDGSIHFLSLHARMDDVAFDWDFSMAAKLFIRWIMTALLLLCKAWFIRHLTLMMLHDNIQQIISSPNFNEPCVLDRYSYSNPIDKVLVSMEDIELKAFIPMFVDGNCFLRSWTMVCVQKASIKLHRHSFWTILSNWNL